MSETYTCEALTPETRDKLKGAFKPQVIAMVADGELEPEQAGLWIVERSVRKLLKERGK